MSIKAALTPALAKLLPRDAASQLAKTSQPGTLYRTLSRLPNDGVGARIYQSRWESKGIQGCFWEVTRVRFRKGEGEHGKAWGRLVWRGKVVSEKEERIPGGLKFKWNEGVSRGNNLKAVNPIPPHPLPSSPVNSDALSSSSSEARSQSSSRTSSEPPSPPPLQPSLPTP